VLSIIRAPPQFKAKFSIKFTLSSINLLLREIIEFSNKFLESDYNLFNSELISTILGIDSLINKFLCKYKAPPLKA
jgi:hypothetical protein